MRYYFNIIGMIVLISAVFGFLAPTMISAKDTFMNLGGFALVILTIPTLFVWGKVAFTSKKRK